MMPSSLIFHPFYMIRRLKKSGSFLNAMPGTLKYNTLIAAIELVNKICDLAINLTEDEVQKLSWSEFVETIEAPELIQYLKERKLYVNEETNTEEEI